MSAVLRTPDCPAWLSDELHANPVFVAEAISNAPDAIAAAYIAGADDATVNRIAEAVDAWIAHWWSRNDAETISRKWKQWAREAQA